MSLVVPGYLDEICTILNFGMECPNGDPDGIEENSRVWHTAAARLREEIPHARGTVDSVRQFYTGTGSDAFEHAAEGVFNGANSMGVAADNADQIGDVLHGGAVSMQDAQYTDLAFAAMTLWQATEVTLTLVSTVFGSAEIPEALAFIYAMGRALIQKTGDELIGTLLRLGAGLPEALRPLLAISVKKLLVAGVKAGLKEGATGLVANAAFQGGQMVVGDRTSFDIGEDVATALSWAAAGAAGHPLGEAINRELGRAGVSTFTRLALSKGAGAVASTVGMWSGGLVGQVADQFVDQGKLSGVSFGFDPRMLLQVGAMEGIGVVKGVLRPSSSHDVGIAGVPAAESVSAAASATHDRPSPRDAHPVQMTTDGAGDPARQMATTRLTPAQSRGRTESATPAPGDRSPVNPATAATEPRQADSPQQHAVVARAAGSDAGDSGRPTPARSQEPAQSVEPTAGAGGRPPDVASEPGPTAGAPDDTPPGGLDPGTAPRAGAATGRGFAAPEPPVGAMTAHPDSTESAALTRIDTNGAAQQLVPAGAHLAGDPAESNQRVLASSASIEDSNPQRRDPVPLVAPEGISASSTSTDRVAGGGDPSASRINRGGETDTPAGPGRPDPRKVTAGPVRRVAGMADRTRSAGGERTDASRGGGQQRSGPEFTPNAAARVDDPTAAGRPVGEPSVRRSSADEGAAAYRADRAPDVAGAAESRREHPGSPDPILPRGSRGLPRRGLPATDEQRELAAGAIAKLAPTGHPGHERLLHPDYPGHADVVIRSRDVATRNAQWWDALSAKERLSVLLDRPHELGNADGIPAHVRDDANRLSIRRDIDGIVAKYPDFPGEGSRLARLLQRRVLSAKDHRQLHNLTHTARSLRVAADLPPDIPRPPVHLIAYDAMAYGGRGRGVVALGSIDFAESVFWHVPGIRTTLNELPLNIDDARNHYEMAVRTDPEMKVASVAWIGYRTPSGWNEIPSENGQGAAGWSNKLNSAVPDVIREAARPSYAIKGGRLFARDLAAFNATRDYRAGACDGWPRPRSHVFGHSYGSTTVCYAGAGGRLADEVDTITLLGSPGAGPLRHAAEFGIDQKKVFVASSSTDKVTWFGGGLPGHSTRIAAGLALRINRGLGVDPAVEAFAARRVAAEYPPGATFRGTYRSHLGYYRFTDTATRTPTESLENLTYIGVGFVDGLTPAPHRPGIDAPAWHQVKLGSLPRDPEQSRTARDLAH